VEFLDVGTKTVDMEAKDRCRLLDLPAELRLRIYEYALAPTGSLALTSTRSKRRATVPVLGPCLLATCRQIYTEAAHILYAENAVCITVDAHDTCWPIVAENRLPQHTLEKVQHLTILLDCTSYFNASYHDVDWDALSALISLRTLRLSLITVGGIPTGTSFVTRQLRPLSDVITGLWPEILERIPPSTEILYGTDANSDERKAADRMIEIRQRGRLDKLTVMEVEREELAEMGLEVTKYVERGCKSGTVEDVFQLHREGSSTTCGAMRV
jgi:hypothetical protein